MSAASRPTLNLQPRSNFLTIQRQFPTKFLPREVLPHHAVASIETAISEHKLADLVLIRSLGCGPSGPLATWKSPVASIVTLSCLALDLSVSLKPSSKIG